MRCTRCGIDNHTGASACRQCGARLGPYARPAPTVPDEVPPEASPAVARLLARSSGAPLVVRAVVDAVRVAFAMSVAVIVSSVSAPALDPFLAGALGSPTAPVVRGALALTLAAILTALIFRITSRRFVRPIRSSS